MPIVLKTLDLARAEFKEQLVLAARSVPAIMPTICNEINSKQEYEKFATLSSLPLPLPVDESELVPEAKPRKLYNKNWQVTKWGQRIRYSYEAKFTDQYQVFSTLGRQTGLRMMQNRESRFGSFLDNGWTNTAAHQGADSLPYFSTTHGKGSGAPTYSNTNTVGRALNSVNLNSAKAQVRRITDANDVPFAYTGSWLLIVPPEKEFAAYEILNSTLQAYTADNTANSAKVNVARAVVADFWTATASWVLLPENKSDHGVFVMYRMPLLTETDIDKQTQDEYIIATEELVIGWTHSNNSYGDLGA